MKNQVLKLDCLEGMARIPSKSVDMIFCDLPYGMLKTKHTLWDIKIPFAPLWEQYARIIKERGAIVLTGVHPFTNQIINSIPKGFKYRSLVWYKSNGSGFLNAKKMHIRQHEDVIVIYQKTPAYVPQKYPIDEKYISKGKAKKRKNSTSGKAFSITGKATKGYVYIDDGTRYPDTVLEFDFNLMDTVLPISSVHAKGMHPTQKPVDLVAYFLKSFTQEGDTVLDNCMGSGTTAEAAILTKRNFIGFETDQEYFNMCQQRIVLAREKMEQDKSSASSEQ